MSALATTSPARAYENMLKSNLQPEEKSMIREWAQKMLGPLEMLGDIRVKDAPGGMLSAFRQGSEGLALAAACAFVHVNVRGGLDVKGVPLDGAGGLGLLLASAFMGHSELGTDARNLGQDATLIFAFRKLTDTFALARAKSGRELYEHLRPGAEYAGHSAKDPVAAAAAAAGL